MKLVLTGFEPFGDHSENPSRLIVRRLAAEGVVGVELVTEELPTIFGEAAARVTALMDRHKPDLLLMVGVAGNRTVISVERIGLNFDDTARPDNAGKAAEARPIRAGGPLARMATLPLVVMRDAISATGLPVEISNHAGTYVCNHVLYAALHHAEETGMATKVGFLHVPQILGATAKSSMSVDDLVIATRAAIGAAIGATTQTRAA